MTYNVFGGTLSLTQSVKSVISLGDGKLGVTVKKWCLRRFIATL